MSKRESLARYSLIIKKLRKRSATFAEIEDYLALESEVQGYNFNVSKRTFQRDRDDIRSLYNIDILFDFSKKVYYIDFDGQPEASERILEAFDRSEEHTSELQSRENLVCRLLLEKK